MAKRELEFIDWKSQKFWSIELKGTSHTVTFGRIGTTGQAKKKDFESEEKAKKSYDKLIGQKLRKGYVDSSEGTSPKTDRHRLNSAFAAINLRGIIALQKAGYTQSDGYEDFQDAYESHRDQSSILGYCFYHEQDLEDAKEGRGIHLAFGPTDPNEEGKKGAEIGRIIREELERVGLNVDWDGAFSTRLHVNLVWDRQSVRQKVIKKAKKAAKRTTKKKAAKKVTAKTAKTSKKSAKKIPKRKAVKTKAATKKANRKK